tara:strand:- start:937 stop:1236 length:300 start_codon:yes stop_codon:yes gene_type:complete
MKREIFDNYATAVANKFHLSLDEMFTKTKKIEVVEARQMLYFLSRERPIRLSYIQKFMEENGHPVTHSTIIHGYKKAKSFVDNDPDYKNVIDSIIKKNV